MANDIAHSGGDSAYDLAIVGGGIAGMCAALRAAQNNLRTVVFLGDHKTAKASRVKYVYNLDNMMGLHASVMRDKYASLFKTRPEIKKEIEAARFHLDTQSLVVNTLERLRNEYAENVRIVPSAVTQVERRGEGFRVGGGGVSFAVGAMVLATGVTDRQPIIRKKRGDKVIEGIQWVYPFANNESFLYCIRCEGHLTRKSSCAVIGFSEGSAQVAIMLHERYRIPVFLLTNGHAPTINDETRRLLALYRIPIYESAIEAIDGSDGGRVLRALVLEDQTRIETRYAMVAMGLYRVFNDLALALNAELENEGPVETRHVLVDYKAETSVPNLFAVGDMIRRKDEPVMKQVYTSQEYAVRAVDIIDGRVRRARRKQLLEEGD